MRLGFCFSRLPEVQNAGFELRFLVSCLFCAAKFAGTDRRVLVSFLSFLLRVCSIQHVLVT